MDNKQLNDVDAFVFDFDGTMCRLFANYDLEKTKVTIKEEMQKYGVQFSINEDAFDIYNDIVEQFQDKDQARELLRIADDIIINAEIQAVESAIIVPGICEMFAKLIGENKKVGIATNNSVDCVKKFMDRKCESIDVPTIGRIGENPHLMKPNPWSVREVCKILEVDPKNILFFGDTQRDYACCENVNCSFMGVASTKRKFERLNRLEADFGIIENYYEIINLL